MPDPSQAIVDGLVYYYRDFMRRTRELARDIPDDRFFVKPYPYGNSFGHLVLHLTGNLNYYFGAQIAGTGYVRHRDLEFTDPNPPSKEEALRRLEEAVGMVIATLQAQRIEDWALPYSAVGVDDPTRFSVVLRCTAHFNHHVGQMIYLVKEHARRS